MPFRIALSQSKRQKRSRDRSEPRTAVRDKFSTRLGELAGRLGRIIGFRQSIKRLRIALMVGGKPRKNRLVDNS
jgi:hypothetical protein